MVVASLGSSIAPLTSSMSVNSLPAENTLLPAPVAVDVPPLDSADDDGQPGESEGASDDSESTNADDEFGGGLDEGDGFGDDLDDDDDLDEFDDIDEDDFDDGFDDDFEEEAGDDYEIEIDDEISAEFGLNTAGEPEEVDADLDDFEDFENVD